MQNGVDIRGLIHRIPKEKLNRFISLLSSEERFALNFDTRYWLRERQIEPKGDYWCWFQLSGRGAGKNFSAATWVIDRVRNGYKHVALIGHTAHDVRQNMVEVGPSSIMKLSPPWFRPKYNPSRRLLEWPNGAVATTYSSIEPDSLSGGNFDTAWIDELAKYGYPDELWENIEMAVREGDSPRICITSTPKPIKLVKDLCMDSDVVVTTESTYMNQNNLSYRFIERIRNQYEGTLLGEQELYGKVIEDVSGALWTRDDITGMVLRPRISLDEVLKKCARVIVSIDPKIKDNNSTETGIIAAGVDSDGIVYILDDVSSSESTTNWVSTAVRKYNSIKADSIVYEANQGGDLVKTLIHQVDSNIKCVAVHASRGKYARAEPVAHYSALGKVKFIENFPDLFGQMCTYVPGSAKSPDRLDACLSYDTIIETKTGKKWIQDIVVGDQVLTRDGYKKVIKSACTGIKGTYEYTFNGDIKICSTPDHLVYVNDEWIEIEMLWLRGLRSEYYPASRDNIFMDSVGYVTVEFSERCDHCVSMPVFNIEVRDYPEYFANGILVHNCVWAVTHLALQESESKYYGEAKAVTRI
jgi:phage terminase large subunit-like protein